MKNSTLFGNNAMVELGNRLQYGDCVLHSPRDFWQQGTIWVDGQNLVLGFTDRNEEPKGGWVLFDWFMALVGRDA